MSLVPTTKLEALNLMLTVVGEAPVQSLTDLESADVALGVRLLDEVSKEVQSHGWHFNTQTNWPLQKDEDGFIYIPSNALQVDIDPNVGSTLDVIVRGNKLYDKTNHTFVFTESPLYVEWIELLDFDQIPDAARRYIAIRAARKFQDRIQGDQAIHAYTEMDELEAKKALMRAESNTADHNIFDHYSAFRTIER